VAASPVPNDRHSSAHVQKGRATAGVQYRLVGGQRCERVQGHWCVHEHPRRRRLLYSRTRRSLTNHAGRRTSVGDQLSACWSHRAQEGRCDRGSCRRCRGPVACRSSALKTAAAAEAAGVAEVAAGAEAAEAAAKEAAQAADGGSVRKREWRSVPAAARPSLPAQPLGRVVALRVSESTGPAAPSGPVARERRCGWDPDQARRRAGVPAPRKGVESTRRRRRRPRGGTPRSRAPSASCLPYPAWFGIGLSVLLPQLGVWEPSTLSPLVRPFNRSFEWCARGASTWTAVAFTPFLPRAARVRVLEAKQVSQ
jgi:hypothetical protein